MTTTIDPNTGVLTHVDLPVDACLQDNRTGRIGGHQGQARETRPTRSRCARKHAFARPKFSTNPRHGFPPTNPQATTGETGVPAGVHVGVVSYYDPTTAQFTTPDPLEDLTADRYGYAGNDPVNGSDPLGLWPWDDLCINNPFGSDNCNSLPEEHPEVTQGVVDFASGVLEANPITAATNALGLTDTSQYANTSSGWYTFGYASMTAFDVLYPAGMAARDARIGREYRVGCGDSRVAPWGNRTGNRYGRWPHYHRRGLNPDGTIREGQGLNRHRPWQQKSPDRWFWDRF